MRDLEVFYNSPQGQDVTGKRSVYLLRNAASSDKGLGFALAGNFYPDFLLWLVDDETGKQWLTFVDPKGLRQMDLSHPKLNLYKEVKVLEKALADQAKEDGPQLLLNAFILSPTKYADLLNIGGTIKNEELENKHVLFIEDGPGVYLSKLFGQLID